MSQAPSIARELRALNLFAHLKQRGFAVVMAGAELMVSPRNCLTGHEAAAIAELKPELMALIAAGEDGELIDFAEIVPELAEWYRGLHPIMKQTFMHAARMRQSHEQISIPAAIRATAKVFRENQATAEG